MTEPSGRALYRRGLSGKGYSIARGEAEILVLAPLRVRSGAQRALDAVYAEIEAYLLSHPGFGGLEPVADDPHAPETVRRMIRASSIAGVGPMAAVAGAVSGYVGQAISAAAAEFTLENGGDVYLRAASPRLAAVYAGDSPLSMKIGIRLPPGDWGVCTSSGTVGPSLSFGHADAAVVVSPNPVLADACATRLGNMIGSAADIGPALERVCALQGVTGAVAVCGGDMGAMGALELLPIEGREGL